MLQFHEDRRLDRQAELRVFVFHSFLKHSSLLPSGVACPSSELEETPLMQTTRNTDSSEKLPPLLGVHIAKNIE
jgi:hypothetical protein